MSAVPATAQPAAPPCWSPRTYTIRRKDFLSLKMKMAEAPVSTPGSRVVSQAPRHVLPTTMAPARPGLLPYQPLRIRPSIGPRWLSSHLQGLCRAACSPLGPCGWLPPRRKLLLPSLCPTLGSQTADASWPSLRHLLPDDPQLKPLSTTRLHHPPDNVHATQPREAAARSSLSVLLRQCGTLSVPSTKTGPVSPALAGQIQALGLCGQLGTPGTGCSGPPHACCLHPGRYQLTS